MSIDLQDDQDTWYKYNVDYEEVAKKQGSRLSNLLDAFQAKGRKDELGISIDDLKKKKPEEIRPILRSAFAKWLWRKYKSGDRYRISIDSAPFITDKDKGIVVEVIEKFKILWDLESELVVAGDKAKGIVYGRKYLLAQPIIITEINGVVEARSTQSGRNFIHKKLGALGVQKIKPRTVSGEVSKNLEQLLLRGTEDMRVVSVHFVESAFPDKSRLTITNDLGIHQDIEFMKRNRLLPNYSVTEMKTLDLKLLESGKTFKLTVHLKEDSYRISLDNSKFSENEREMIRSLLLKAGIEIDAEYSFRVESDLSTIFHKIMSRSKKAYDQYFSKLPLPYKTIINEVTYFEDRTEATCSGCGLEVRKNKSCPDCGCTDIKEKSSDHLQINKPAVRDLVYKRLSKIGESFDVKIEGKNNKHFLNFKLEKVDSAEILCQFTRVEESETAPRVLNIAYSLVMNSGETIPARYDEDIRNVGLVTFGDAIYRERSTFTVGTINFLDLLAKKPEELRVSFSDAVDSTFAHLEDRILPLSAEGLERLIKGIYDADGKDFERDIFYILKRMFPLSARYGRVGIRESDGLIIFTDGQYKTTIASYDTKHSWTKYRLGAGEQNKATYYLLDAKMNDDLDSISEGKSLNAHVTISNSLTDQQWKSYVDGVNDFLKLAEDGGNRKLPTLVLLRLKELLEFYSIYREFSFVINGDATVKGKFHDAFKELFKTPDSAKVIGATEVSDFRNKVLTAVQNSTRILNFAEGSKKKSS
jgi:hypothetical protein